MKIAIQDKDNWTMHGARILLEQLGISYEVSRSSLECGDIFITDENVSIPSNKAGIIINSPSKETKELGESFVIYKNAKAYYPNSRVVPLRLDSFEVIASFEDGEPAIIRQENNIYILPNFFEYIAKATTLRVYNKTFAQSFSWDEFRQIFLFLLQYIADYLHKSLIRIYYYPSMENINSVTYTTDVDYNLQWEIISNLNRQVRLKSLGAKYLPYYCSIVLGHAVMHRYKGVRKYNNELFSWKGAFGIFLGKLFKKSHLVLPPSFYLASICQLYHKNMPITAFVRASDYQKEEKKEVYPFREGYKAERLDYLDMGLHYGTSIGLIDHGFVENPYEEDTFREGIFHQIECLRKDIEQDQFGTRLHNIYMFNQEIFYYLNQRSILYDSSIFGMIGPARDTNYSPAGVSLPYYPVLLSDMNLHGGLVKANFVELPVAIYETPDIPFDKMAKNNSAIVISEHSDKIKSPIVKKFLYGYGKYRKDWWGVTLRELASWWNERQKVRVEHESGEVKICGVNANGLRLCLVIYPLQERIRLPNICHIIKNNKRDNEIYLDVILKMKSQVLKGVKNDHGAE